MAGYLLDTHIVYWWMTGDKRLRKTMLKLIADEACAVSVLSIWEMVLKNARGKLPLPAGPIDESLENKDFASYRYMRGTWKPAAGSRRITLILSIVCCLPQHRWSI